MIIKSGNNINKLQTEKIDLKKKKETEVPFDIKDILLLGPVGKGTVNFLKSYRNLKIEQTQEKTEPWWAEVADAAHIQGDVVHGLGLHGKIAMASTIGSGLGAIGLGILGTMELKEGIKEKDTLKAIGGGSALLAGAASGTDFLIAAAESHGYLSGAGAGFVHIAEPAAQVFAVTHGAINIAMGGRELIHGIKEKKTEAIIDGSLEIGIGSTMIMTALGYGGIYAPIALGTLFTAKLAYDHREGIAKLGKKLTGKE